MLLLELGIFLTFATAYVTSCLVFEEKSEPWESAEEVVKWQEADGNHEKPVSAFDQVRRLFGAYKLEGKVWFVNPLRMALWRCNFCLSFWIALVLTVPALLVAGYSIWLVPLMVLAVAGAAQVAMK